LGVLADGKLRIVATGVEKVSCHELVGSRLIAKGLCRSISLHSNIGDTCDVVSSRNNLTAFLVWYRNVDDKAFAQRGLPNLFLGWERIPICFSPLNKAYIDIPRFDARRFS
jgi:hypothetical protein